MRPMLQYILFETWFAKALLNLSVSLLTFLFPASRHLETNPEILTSGGSRGVCVCVCVRVRACVRILYYLGVCLFSSGLHWCMFQSLNCMNAPVIQHCGILLAVLQVWRKPASFQRWTRHPKQVSTHTHTHPRTSVFVWRLTMHSQAPYPNYHN